MASLTSREEYLKRYLSGQDDGKKKKRKKKVGAPAAKKLTVRIIDEDADIPEAVESSEDENAGVPDGAFVAEIVDDGPIRGADMSRWKKLAEDSPAQNPASSATSRARHDSPDFSPPRRQRHDTPEPDMSPPRRQRHDSPDLSPPRRQRHDSPDLSPPRRKRQDSPDLSPPRRKRQDSPDLSPPRRSRGNEEDLSPPRRRPADTDLSPPRKRKAGSPDLSPPRRPRMADGSSSGLVRADRLAEQARLKKEADEQKWAKLDSAQLGRGAETIVRDRATGKKVDVKLERLKQREAEAKKMEEEEKYLRWGSGVAQERSRQDKMEEDLREMAKPLARYRDDADLDELLKQRERADDPMAHLVKKKKKNKRPTYQGPRPPPNRFNIWPGYRWDGVDRSNGFEKRLFQMQADRQATASEAYAWSTEDM